MKVKHFFVCHIHNFFMLAAVSIHFCTDFRLFLTSSRLSQDPCEIWLMIWHSWWSTSSPNSFALKSNASGNRPEGSPISYDAGDPTTNHSWIISRDLFSAASCMNKLHFITSFLLQGTGTDKQGQWQNKPSSRPLNWLHHDRRGSWYLAPATDFCLQSKPFPIQEQTNKNN